MDRIILKCRCGRTILALAKHKTRKCAACSYVNNVKKRSVEGPVKIAKTRELLEANNQSQIKSIRFEETNRKVVKSRKRVKKMTE